MPQPKEYVRMDLTATAKSTCRERLEAETEGIRGFEFGASVSSLPDRDRDLAKHFE